MSGKVPAVREAAGSRNPAAGLCAGRWPESGGGDVRGWQPGSGGTGRVHPLPVSGLAQGADRYGNPRVR
jgi:hypothetical protein